MPRLSIDEALKNKSTSTAPVAREGFDLSTFQTSLAESKPNQTTSVPDSNLGTGFTPSFESLPSDKH